jgi:hypothetical protein
MVKRVQKSILNRPGVLAHLYMVLKPVSAFKFVTIRVSDSFEAVFVEFKIATRSFNYN